MLGNGEAGAGQLRNGLVLACLQSFCHSPYQRVSSSLIAFACQRLVCARGMCRSGVDIDPGWREQCFRKDCSVRPGVIPADGSNSQVTAQSKPLTSSFPYPRISQ